MMRVQVDGKGATPEEYLLVLGLFGEEAIWDPEVQKWVAR